jgi:DNA-directed RNA polymerase specialized sigma24 family protein
VRLNNDGRDGGRAVVGGRPAGFTDFFRAEYETLLRAMYLLTGDRYEAEDLAQDAFVKACERWDRVRRMDNPTGYLYRTAVNAHKSTFDASEAPHDVTS